jgi:hypothetical protein
MWWGYTSVNGMSVTVLMDNVLNIKAPPAFDGYYSVDGIVSDNTRSASMSNITGDFVDGGGA